MKKAKNRGGFGSTSSPLLFLVGGENHCHLRRRKTHKPVDFNFFLIPGLGSIFFFALICCSFLLPVVDLAVVEGATLVVFPLVGSNGCWLYGCCPVLAAAGESFGVDGDEEIGEDGEAADKRGERRGTALPSFLS